MSVAFGDFNALNLPKSTRDMVESGFQAVSAVEGGWDFLKTYEPGEGGFMFSTPPPKMKEINNEIMKRYGGHSGGSYGSTMRVLELIAKKGWDTYVEGTKKQNIKNETMTEKRERFLALPKNMTLEEQMKAIEEFKDVPMTYSELRERFG
jgi:hypothetical protein